MNDRILMRAADKSRSPLTFQVTLTVLALAVFALAMIFGFGFYATVQADQASLARQKIFFSDGLKDQMAGVVREQESVTVWDDSVVNAKAGNQAWMAENLSVWMYTYYGHDRVYILDAANTPIHAMREGKVVPASSFAEDAAAIEPTVARLRGLIALADNDDPNDDPPKLVAEDIVTIAGEPAILSIMPLVPSSDRVRQDAGTEYLDVSVQYIDDVLIKRIGDQYLLTGAHLLGLAQAAPAASVPLIDSHGVILGYVAWDQERPGMALVRKASPALAVGVLLAGGMIAWLLRRLRKASTALQVSQDQARYLALHDTLTGLPNRALFEDRLRQALAAANRGRTRMALLYLDLDRFKHVNDTLGHPAGDELVRQTAARLQHAVREVDTVARLGGDEFAVVLPDIGNMRNAQDVADMLLRRLSAPFELTGHQVFVGASIGIAISGDGADAEDLLRKADIALYEAKKNGRNRAEVFAGDMDDILIRKRRIESELRLALVNGAGLKLVYQPIFAADGTTVLGVEALIRWEHDVHGALPTMQFVAIAEERGMIGQLGEWALREACRFAAGGTLPWVAVNVSPLQLRDAGFAARVEAILAETGLAATRLQIEITESVLLENSGTTRTVLAALRHVGVAIVLDDFGTGYSSLNYLRRHAIDKLKIDRSFIRQLEDDESAVAIVKAIIDLATALKVGVTAEGVETEEQKTLLVTMGCQHLQGFLLSPPVDGALLLEAAPAQDGGAKAARA